MRRVAEAGRHGSRRAPATARRPRQRGARPTLTPVRSDDHGTTDVQRHLLSRSELAARTGEREHTLYKWWRNRHRNGHPEGVEVDGQWHVDESEWRRWRTAYGADRREIDGRILATVTELARLSGEPEATLNRWYAGRRVNGHPPGIRRDGRRYVDLEQWQDWYRGHKDQLKSGLTPVDRTGDPDELLNSAQVAHVLGLANAATVNSYVGRGQFIEPDEVEETPAGRKRRFWRRRRVWEYADNRSWSRKGKSSTEA